MIRNITTGLLALALIFQFILALRQQSRLDELILSNGRTLSAVRDYRETHMVLIDIYRNDLRDLVYKMSLKQSDWVCGSNERALVLAEASHREVLEYYGR